MLYDRLSDEQKSVVDSWGKGLAVVAGAGCGKTTTLVAKCLRFVEMNPEGKFVAVSFTEKSASDLRTKLFQSLPVTSASSRHRVTTIHGLCSSIIREFPREAGFEGDERIAAEWESEVIWEESLRKLWAGDLSESLKQSLRRLLSRESRSGLEMLIGRMRRVFEMGYEDHFDGGEDLDLKSVFELSGYVTKHYQRLKERQGVMDFADLEQGAKRALRELHVRRSYHNRFQLVLVDEFQDTNPLQAEIIWSFAKPDHSNLCVVGDPKQSIYRFRDADVQSFVEITRKLPRQLSLTGNYRSRPKIIEFTNQVCAPLFEPSNFEYDELRATQEDAEYSSVIRLDVQKPEDLCRWMISEVERGLSWGDMAILFRKIRGNESWIQALASSGIPFVIGSGGLFWDDPLARELTAFLRWWDNPENRLSAVVFFRSPWVGIPDQVCDEWIRSDQSLEECFFSSDYPIAKVLQKVRSKNLRPGELLLQLLKVDPLEEQIGAEILALWHRVEDFSLKGFGFSEVIQEISHSMESKRRESVVPPPLDGGKLTILTLHGAKGLEFSHVILVDLQGKKRASDLPLLFWNRQIEFNGGLYLGKRNKDGDRLARDPSEKKWRDFERVCELEESKRLFYVALTRAKDRLVLAFPSGSEKSDLDREKAISQDNWRGWIETLGGELPKESISEDPVTLKSVNKELEENPTSLRSQRGFPKPIEWMRPRHSVTEWNVLSQCERQYEWKYLSVSPLNSIAPQSPAELNFQSFQKKPSEKIPGNSKLDFSQLGTQVHSCIERLDLDGLRELEKEYGKKVFNSNALIQWIENSPLMDSGLLAWNELAFEVPVHQDVLVGTIDRLVFHSDRYTLMDYKVTSSERSPAELIRDYQRQIFLYAWAVCRLEEKAQHHLDLQLVHISPSSVKNVPVEISKDDEWVFYDVGKSSDHPVSTWLQQANQIVNGKKGQPIVGRACDHCDFVKLCPEGASKVSR